MIGMVRVEDVCRYLDTIAPSHLAAAWDNAGLLVGRTDQPVSRVMTCLSVTQAVVREAMDEEVQLIVTHHPLPFRPLKRVTGADSVGQRLLDLIEAKIAVYSPHTRWDSADGGINELLSQLMGLGQVRPIIESSGESAGPPGSGRWGRLPSAQTVQQIGQTLLDRLKSNCYLLVGNPSQSVEYVAVACGAGDDFVPLAVQRGCQLLVTGELRFHSAMEAECFGMSVVALGHYVSERFGVEQLASRLALAFPQLRIWASVRERDVWQYVTAPDRSAI